MQEPGAGLIDHHGRSTSIEYHGQGGCVVEGVGLGGSNTMRRLSDHPHAAAKVRRVAPRATVCLLLLTVVTGIQIRSSAPAQATPLPQTVEGWIYPSSLGQPTCDVPAELSSLSSAPIALLKPEYLSISNSGRVTTETAASLPCNGYSQANLASVRSAAQNVYVTVSAGTRGTKALLNKPAHRATALAALTSFAVSNSVERGGPRFRAEPMVNDDVE